MTEEEYVRVSDKVNIRNAIDCLGHVIHSGSDDKFISKAEYNLVMSLLMAWEGKLFDLAHDMLA